MAGRLWGVAGRNGVRKFSSRLDTVSSSFQFDEAEGTNIREIEVFTLDSLTVSKQITKSIDLLKLDAEGLELEILQGGTETLARTRIIMLEISLFKYHLDRPTFSQIVAEMDRHNFSIYDFTMFYRRPFDHAIGLMDCIFVSDSCSLKASDRWG